MAPMRDDIYTAIMKGGATKESLLELTGTTEKGLASQFTYLRMTGKCPKKQEDGTFTIISEEEWAEHRAAGKGTGGKVLTPAERVEKAQKRSDRASTASTNATKRSDAKPDDNLLLLKATKADCELQIAEIELGQAEEALRNAPPEEVVAEDPEAEEPVAEDAVPEDEEPAVEETPEFGGYDENGDLV